MTQASTYSCYDRFIGSKFNQNNFGIYSLNSAPFQDFKESSYSCLIKKNLFGGSKGIQEERTNWDSKKSNGLGKLEIKGCGSMFQYEQKNVLSPVKILDVPNIKDDFYLNLIDWHSKGPIGIALLDQTYIYTAKQIIRLSKSIFNTYISSLKFNQSILSVGLSNGMVEIYDLEKSSLLRVFTSHSQRVSTIAFTQNLLIAGSRDKAITFNDLRVKYSLIRTLQAHNGQLCTLKVKPDQKNVFASGANDNKVLLWDIRTDSPFSTMKGHKGAVKAISWCPWKTNTLATGGGRNDRTIKIWGQNMNLICEKQLKSQISGLEWNTKQKCLISSHGSNFNEVCLWNWNGSEKLSKINGSKSYSKRVLSLIQSNQEDMVCTLSSDQTMKFFEFKSGQSAKKQIYDTQSSRIYDTQDGFQRIL